MNPRARRRWAWGLGAIGGLVSLAAIAAALSGLPAHAPGSASLPEGSGPTGATVRPTGGSAEDGWSLPCLANACRANDLSELFE